FTAQINTSPHPSNGAHNSKGSADHTHTETHTHTHTHTHTETPFHPPNTHTHRNTLPPPTHPPTHTHTQKHPSTPHNTHLSESTIVFFFFLSVTHIVST